MLSSLVLCLALAGRLGADPPQSLNHRFQVLPPFDIEKFHRQHLEFTKNRRVGLEKMLESFERDLFPTEADRQQLAYLREGAQYLRKIEQVLEWYEQQRRLKPGPETDQEAIDTIDTVLKEQKAWQNKWDRTAPPPREKKQR